MPSAAQLRAAAIDWPAIRAQAVLIGVREAARQFGADLPPDELATFTSRVMQRCHREGWIRAKTEAAAIIVTGKGAPRQLSATVSGAQAASNYEASKKAIIRSNLTRYLVNGSKVAARSRSPLEDAHNVKALAGVMAAIYPEAAAAPQVQLNVWSAGMGEGSGP